MPISYKPDKNNISEFQKIEDTFFNVDFLTPANRPQIYQELNSYFSTATIGDILFYRNTYWKLFVYATWHDFNVLSEEDLLRAVTYQIPDAFAMDYDVLESIMWYLILVTKTYDDRKALYQKIKDNFFNSNMVLGVAGNNNITISSIVTETIRLDQRKNDSMQTAALLARLKTMMSGNKISSKYVYADETKFAGSFFDLIHFFIGVETDGIGFVLDSFEIKDTFAETESDTSGISDAQKEKVIPTAPPVQVVKPFPEEFVEHKNDFVHWMIHAITMREMLVWLEKFHDNKKARAELFNLIQQNIDEKNLENNDFITALVRLDEFLVKNNYGGNDFIHFDEKNSAFVWNK